MGAYIVVCGTGNNGGDGLAIARHLLATGATVHVLRIHSDSYSTDNTANARRLLASGGTIMDIKDPSELPALKKNDVIIDALLGTGLSRPLEGLPAEVVRWVNSSGCRVVAVDMPSGLMPEVAADRNANIIRAYVTLTFQTPKLAFFFRENAPFVGEWRLLPIGLDEATLAALKVPCFLVGQDTIGSLLRPRGRFAHKGDGGHALLVAGRKGMMGAAVLAARACSRSGTGLVSVHVPKDGLAIMQMAVPDAMCSVDTGNDHSSELPSLERATAIGIGPGIGMDIATQGLLKLLIQECRVPLVLDADALSMIAANRTWLAFLPENTVLTPHPKEFDRIAGTSSDSRERLDRAKELAIKHGIHIVLKGAFTAVCAPGGKVFFNSTGNAGMAKGGSGDALTGFLTGLLAQGYPTLDACLLATHLHGLAGDLAALELGMDGMTAGDLVNHLPAAWQELRR